MRMQPELASSSLYIAAKQVLENVFGLFYVSICCVTSDIDNILYEVLQRLCLFVLFK